MKKPKGYWRAIVATCAEIERNLVTQFSPKGLGEWSGTGEWWQVRMGRLVLSHESGWIFTHREENLEERLVYAHRTWQEALAALRAEVSPDEPAYAQVLESIYGQKRGVSR